MYDTPRQPVIKIVPVKIRTSIGNARERHTLIAVPVQTMEGLKQKPASKPADPAFKNALRQRPMRIGLRYVGD